jgi:hypothetical protein
MPGRERSGTVAADPSWHIVCTCSFVPTTSVFEMLENAMTTRRFFAAPAAIFLVCSACASVDVRTATSPDANFAALHTFNVKANPKLRSQTSQATNDPMLVNSISNRALRADLFKGFENRGYAVSDAPDFVVAYYACATNKLDVTYWDYGYPFWEDGWGPWWGGYDTSVTQYTQGTVIVDVLNPTTNELLWRGQGVATVSDDEAQYVQDLWKTVSAILDKFPQALQRS